MCCRKSTSANAGCERTGTGTTARAVYAASAAGTNAKRDCEGKHVNEDLVATRNATYQMPRARSPFSRH